MCSVVKFFYQDEIIPIRYEGGRLRDRIITMVLSSFPVMQIEYKQSRFSITHTNQHKTNDFNNLNGVFIDVIKPKL